MMKSAVHPMGSFEDMRVALGVELRQINLQRQQQDEKFAMLEQQMTNLSQQVAAVPLQLERSLQAHQACVAQQIRESSSRSRPPSRGLDGLNLMGSTSGSSQRESPQSHKGGSGSECSEDGGRSMLANDALSEHASSFAKRFGNLSTTDTRRLLTRLEPSGANRWCNEFIESMPTSGKSPTTCRSIGSMTTRVQLTIKSFRTPILATFRSQGPKARLLLSLPPHQRRLLAKQCSRRSLGLSVTATRR